MKINGRTVSIFKSFAIWILCAVLLLGSLTSCSKSDSLIAEDGAAGTVENGMDSATGSATPGVADKGGNAYHSLTSNTDSAEVALPKKIIRNATVTAESKSFDAAVAEMEATLAALGGYVESSQITGRNASGQTGGGNRSATFAMRIPAERLDEFLEKTGTLVNVISSYTTAEDVSSQYYDIEARLSVLETERQVLERMLSESDTVSNMITVENRLYDVIYEIESYKTQLKLYDSMVAYSTVRLTLNEVTDLTVLAENNTFGARLKQAIGETWQNFAEFCKEALIWLIYALPVLILLGAVGTVAAVVTVKSVKRRKKKTEEQETEPRE